MASTPNERSDAAAVDPVLCIVGVGPRGTSVVERLAALATELAPEARWTLHLVDDAPLGAGRIWRTDQVHELCMNTLAGAVTLFTDERSTVRAPRVDGPTLYEWCLLAHESLHPDAVDPAAALVPAAHRAAFGEVALPAALTDHAHLVAELDGIRPESHPSRALYGAYATWCLDRALAALPRTVRVLTHRTRATAVVESGDGRERVLLADDGRIDADAVILSLGWLRSEPPIGDRLRQREAEAAGLTWIRDASPVEQPLDRIPAGATTIVRGLGMGFFDAMALLSSGRGGRFTGSGDALVYLPSGEEPVLHVTSNRGLPFRAKTRYGRLPPRAEQTFFSRFDPSALGRRIDFEIDLLPLIEQDGHAGWYRRRHELHPEAFAAPLEEVIATIADPALRGTDLDAAIAALVPRAEDRFDLGAAADPVPGRFDSPAAYQEAVLAFVRADLHESALGERSALKAALWEMNAARGAVARYLSFDAATAETHASPAYRRFLAFGGMIGSGPPAFRNAQLLALAEAGLVHFLGPAATIAVDGDAFVATSAQVNGSAVRATVLLDAFLAGHDAGSTRDPLLAGLAGRGVLRSHTRVAIDGSRIAGPGIDVDPASGRLRRGDGILNPRIHAIGIPVNDNRGDTIVSPMPRTDAMFLRESDGAACAAFGTLFPRLIPMPAPAPSPVPATELETSRV